MSTTEEESSQSYETSTVSTPRLRHIRYIDHGQSRLWRKTIYDVDGNPVLGANGVPISFFHSELKTLFLNKTVQLYHRMNEPSYRYIISSKDQLRRFLEDRFYGTEELKVYHVYSDEDSDKSHPDYKAFFTPSVPSYNRYKSV